MTTKVGKPSEEGLIMLESLRRAVEKALDKKARLGQYAVVWKDGSPHFIGPDAPEQRKDPVSLPTKTSRLTDSGK